MRGAFPEEVWVTGEVRSMKVLTKGHCFLDLVDPAQADDPGAPTLSAKCWAGTWRSIRVALERLGITLEAGMVVRVRGEVGLYKARGSIDFARAGARYRGAVGPGGGRAGAACAGAGRRGSLRPTTAAARPFSSASGGPGGQPRHRGLQRFPRGSGRLGSGFRCHRDTDHRPGEGRTRPAGDRHLAAPAPAGRCDRGRPRGWFQGRSRRLRPGGGGPGRRNLGHPRVDGHRSHR